MKRGHRTAWAPLGLLVASLAVFVNARADGPFAAEARLSKTADGKLHLSVSFTVQEGHYLYADRIEIDVQGSAKLVPERIPAPKQHLDPILEETVRVYEQATTLLYTVKGAAELPLNVSVSFQGCSNALCYPPATTTFALDPGGQAGAQTTSTAVTSEPPTSAGPGDWQQIAEQFTVTGRAAGYVAPSGFLAFLERTEAGEGLGEDALSSTFRQKGIWVTLALIIIGGLALNLTPCVLPMIPVNIAIIGAGSQASSRTRGFVLGGTYGAGIALTYGLLGMLVVLTGARFGTLNSNPFFNLGVAAVFVLLALAMFDVFTVDFSRLQSRIGTQDSKRGSFITAFFLGGVAALLAGACVAPVVISVLLLSAKLYSSGTASALALPFLLGLSMALPWPLMGAGLSFLPKPGKWMERVKMVFGLTILVIALWYGKTGVSLLLERSAASRAAVTAAQQHATEDGWLTSLSQALTAARDRGQPLFIDFWASWCKNCLKMEKTTFKDAAVQARLDAYVKVKVRAEDMRAPNVRSVLDHFDVIGLPTYIILEPPPKDAPGG